MNYKHILSAAALMWLLIFSPLVLICAIILLLIGFAFRLPIRKGQKANLERLNGTFGQRPRTDGKIDLCCPECFSKDYKKVNNHYECPCGANWI